MGRIAVVGSSNIDLVIKGFKLPRPGETVLGGHFFEAYGGKGANQAVAAARAGAETAFIARVGSDAFGTRMLANFKADGIDTAGVSITDGPSGAALIMVDKKGENMIAVAPGANAGLSAADIDRSAEVISRSDAVLVQLEVPLEAVYAAVHQAHAAGRTTVLNPAPAPSEPLDPDVIACIDYLVPNRVELGMLVGRPVRSVPEIRAAAAVLIKQGTRCVIVTLGREGVYFDNGKEHGTVPSREVKAVDTVGAGDCFAGCLTTGLAEGMDIKTAITFAAAAASISVTRMGAQPSMPYRHEIAEALGEKDGNV